MKNLSENIQVKSILGRFLEHSRIFFFRNGAEDISNSLFFIGSSDWMKRNLYSRVEALSPIYQKKAKKELWNLLSLLWKDEASCWLLKADGSYSPPKQPFAKSLQDKILKNFMKKIKNI